MITAITFQFSYKNKYINPADKMPGVYGQRTTEDLQNSICEDLGFLNAIHHVVANLNKDLQNANVTEIISQHLGGHRATVRHITKTKRTYSIAGLTIHEEDKNENK